MNYELQSRVVVEAGISETETETWVAETKTETEASKLGLKAGLEAGSRDPADKTGSSETKTEIWAAETKTETEAIKIKSRRRPRERGRSSRPPSLIPDHPNH